jgi:hypothetical protein
MYHTISHLYSTILWWGLLQENGLQQIGSYRLDFRGE